MRDGGIAVKVGPGEHAVHVDSWSGDLAPIEGAGYHLAVPGFAEVFRFDKASRTLTMRHEDQEKPGNVGRLRIRSRDGSAFFFDNVELEYRVTEAGAAQFLADSGGQMERGAMWVMALARPVL